MMRRLGLCLLTLQLTWPSLAADDITPLITRIKAVGSQGAGNAESARAWKQLVQQGPAALVPILRGFDDANPYAANWLRSAFEAIAEREVNDKRPLPTKELEAFV